MLFVCRRLIFIKSFSYPRPLTCLPPVQEPPLTSTVNLPAGTHMSALNLRSVGRISLSMTSCKQTSYFPSMYLINSRYSALFSIESFLKREVIFFILRIWECFTRSKRFFLFYRDSSNHLGI